MDKNVILKDLSGFGKQFKNTGLCENDMKPNPINQFVDWIDHAIKVGSDEPNPMVLSTVSEDNKPSSRVVLLKYITEQGFVFFTNYESRKGQNLEINPNASAVFFWKELERQVRIEGRVEKTDTAFSDAYFKSRPFESQIGALSSPQSTVISSRQYLLEKMEELRQTFKGKSLIRPYFWGGYVLIPSLMEFWQGGPNRVSDRFQYKLEKGNWIIERLAP
jgi:pyridoxamine 5'-phosphate oxidase